MCLSRPFSAAKSAALHLKIAILLTAVGLFASMAYANVMDIVGPTGSGAFGTQVLVLDNGNIVVTDPGYLGGVGAVYLLRPDGARISRLTGSVINDRVGSHGVFEVGNSNFVVVSRNWSNAGAANAGAVTWVDGAIGLNAAVGSDNSLVGSQSGDVIGASNSVVLSNGNYVVLSPFWNNGSAVNAGAVTFGIGNVGVRGTVSASNSLVGSAEDYVGLSGVVALHNGNYVVCSMRWHNGNAINAGAVTWASGIAGVAGLVSTANSLVGTSSNDAVGEACAVPLSNGNYVVASRSWNNGSVNGVGAVTFGNGAFGIRGPVTAANSLIGTSTSDRIGADNELGRGVVALSNGNYVVVSPSWNNGSIDDAGAVTFGNGVSGVIGQITSSNSLVGTQLDERVGNSGVTALSNGNYVIASNLWDNGGLSNVGAVTWANGSTGRTGTISATNSLIGSTAHDNIGNGGITALRNGNYAVASYLWNISVVIDAGAVTWGNGFTGSVGTVGDNPSLIGARPLDFVGLGSVTALSNGHYVVLSPNADFQSNIIDAGALSWRDGSGGASALTIISSSNSLIGLASDSMQRCAVQALPGNRYGVACPNLQGDMAGGASFVSAIGPTGGALIPTAWLGSAGDELGSGGIFPLDEAHYALVSPLFDSGRGAISLGVLPNSGLQSPNDANSVIGAATTSIGGETLVFDFDPARDNLYVGQRLVNRVSILNLSRLFANGFE